MVKHASFPKNGSDEKLVSVKNLKMAPSGAEMSVLRNTIAQKQMFYYALCVFIWNLYFITHD